MRKLLNILSNLYNMAGYDGLKHIVLSAVLTVGFNLFLPWWCAAMVTLSIGMAKEIYDKLSEKGCCEWKDIMCDIIGIIIGAL